MGVAGCGHRPLSTWLAGGIFCGDQAHKLQQFSWGLTTRPVAQVRHEGNGPGTLHTTPRLPGLDHRVHTPRWHGRVAFWLKTLEAFGVFVDRADLCLPDDLLSRCGQTPSESQRRGAGPEWARPT